MALEAKGYQCDANLVKEETYGTLDTDTPVTTAFPIVTETLTQEPSYLEDDTKTGANAAAKAPTLDKMKSPTGNTVSYLDYHNFEEVFHQAIGAVAGTGASATPFYWDPDDEITTSYSLVIDKVKERFQYTGGFIKGFTIKGTAGDEPRIMLTTDWLFQKLTRSATALASASLTASEYMKMSQLVFRIGTQADALDADDSLKITDFEFSFQNNWLEKYESESAYMMQPIRDIPREVTLSFTASRYNSDAEIAAIQTAIEGGTKLQADLTFTGGTSPRAFKIELPELMKCTAYPNAPIAGAGGLVFTTKLQAYVNSAVATIMKDVAYETQLTLTQTA